MSTYPPGSLPQPALPADPLSRGPFMPTLPGEDDLRQRILAMLVAKGGLAERTGALHPVYQNPVGGQPLSGGQVFLRSLVSGYNGQAEPDVKQAKALSALLSLDQTQAYRQGQLGLGAGRLADSQARTALTAAQQDPTKIGSRAWALKSGLDPDQPGSMAWNHVMAHDVAQQNANTAKGNLGERTRHDIVGEGQARVDETGRMTRHNTPGAGGRGPLYGFRTKAANINARAQADIGQRTAAMVALGIKNGWTKQQIAAGVARVKADTQARHQKALSELNAQYGNAVPGLTNQGDTPPAATAPDPLGLR